MERTKIIRQFLNGQWTVMDSSFLKSLTGTARIRGTRDKFRNSTVHYCPLSKNQYIWVGVGGGCFPNYSRVPRARSTRDSFLFYPTPTPTHVQSTVGPRCVLRAQAARDSFMMMWSPFLTFPGIKSLVVSGIIIIFVRKINVR